MGSYAIADLVVDVKAVQQQNETPEAVTAAVAGLIGRMLDDTGWVEERFYRCDEEQGFGISVLHEEPEALLIEMICWLPGRGVTPHDHQTWGVVLGLDGAEHNTMWQRNDDGSREGFADIIAADEQVVRRGDICTLMPDDIHSIHNEGDEPSLSLHVYGKSLSLTGRSEFDPEAKSVRPCPVRTRNE